MEREVRQSGRLYELPNSSAISGTKIHAWEAQEASGLTPEVELDSNELATAEQCLDLRRAALDSWKLDAQCNGDIELIVERRFWYRRGLVPIFSGQPDILAIDHHLHRAIVLNYKTGRLEADEAADNLQLRTEVVLLKHNYPDLEEISAAIIEPWISWDSVQVVYKGDDLRQAENQILAIVDRTLWEADKRVAGAWCRYCTAKTYCAEAIKFAQTIRKFDPEKMIAELPRGEAGTQLWERIKTAKKLLEAMEVAYTKILETEAEALPGYILPTKGKARRRVVYPEKLKAALAEYLTPEEIDGCADYRLAKIEELIGIKHRIEDKKELSRLFQQLTKNVIDITFDQPFIRALTRREKEMLAKV